MSGGRFGCSRLGSYPAGTAVVAHSIHRDVIDDRLVVDIGDVRSADIGHRPVVIEMVVLPITPLVTAAAVPVTVIHSAIEADLGAPVAYIPYENATPIAPIARRPKVALSGNRRLFVDRKFRRRHVD